jgi:2,3-bisphosphoglycerate-independent phosphoglycerate mutase
VPFFVIDNEWKGDLEAGKLADLAPTILTMMQLPLPPQMTGNILTNKL